MPVCENDDPDIRSMRGIHLYQYFLSNCAQRVCIALEEKGLAWTPHPINLFTQENTREEYFRINPKGLVPALVHDGVVITESIDILRYIEERFPEPALYPPDDAERRKVDEWMNLATERELFALYDSLEKELGEHRWLVGDRFTFADIAWFVQYFLNDRTGVVDFRNYPNIRRWGRLSSSGPPSSAA